MAATAVGVPSLFASLPFISHRHRRFLFTTIAAAAAASSRSRSPIPALPRSNKSDKEREFNISFRTPDVVTPSSTAASSKTTMLIPWIVRGEDGNLTLRTSPPPEYLQAIALEEKGRVAKKKKTPAKPPPTANAAPAMQPKRSKAARRFYNDVIRADTEPQRLNKVLAAAGVASRRSSEELIFQGKVTINGAVCTSPQTKVDLSKDSIYVNGNRLSKRLPQKLYFALNKPKGYICSCGEESKTVVSLFNEYLKNWGKKNPGTPKPRLFTVGRLDVATTGLIIVTNDGEFAQKLAHPSSGLSKEYLATVDGPVHRKNLIAISEGTEVDGVKCIPDSVELLPRETDSARPRLRIVVHEGRNHEVRELVQNAGLKVYSLKRVRIGKLRLPTDLGIGKFVELKQADIKLLENGIQSSE